VRANGSTRVLQKAQDFTFLFPLSPPDFWPCRRRPAVAKSRLPYDSIFSSIGIMAAHWSQELHRLLKQQNVRQVSFVPDAGHTALIKLCEADNELRAVRLTTEEGRHRARSRRMARRETRACC
jgi:hypothetical protein